MYIIHSLGIRKKSDELVETLAVCVSEFFQTLATSSGFNALLFFRRLFIALTLLHVRDDSVLFARLGETLESAFERFIRLNYDTDHSDSSG